MGIEGGSFERTLQDVVQERDRLEDMGIREAFSDPESERILQEGNPVLWLKGAIGIDTGRGASEISDLELRDRYYNGGRFEWDPIVSRQVAAYLHTQRTSKSS